MTNPLAALPIVYHQWMSPQILPRTPEPAGMTNPQSVAEYDKALESKLVIAYAGAMELIHRARRSTQGGQAIDLCCGPGHFTLFMAKYLGYEKVIGIDLSPPMIEAARQNAIQAGLADRVEFIVGDAINVEAAYRTQYDLVTCNDAAHHMPTLELVGDLMQTMQELVKPDGLVLLMDLVRLRREDITEDYVDLIGQDYVARKLHAFQEDFRNSMYAAWTREELSSAVPNDSSRNWKHMVQRLLPTIQMILGYPSDGQPMRLRRGLPWTAENNPVPANLRNDWRMFRALM